MEQPLPKSTSDKDLRKLAICGALILLAGLIAVFAATSLGKTETAQSFHSLKEIEQRLNYRGFRNLHRPETAPPFRPLTGDISLPPGQPAKGRFYYEERTLVVRDNAGQEKERIFVPLVNPRGELDYLLFCKEE